MRLAVIDCGTNTFNLIIIELSPTRRYNKLFNTRIPVKLGEGAINKGFIAPVPFRRGLDAIETLAGFTQKYKAERVLAFATSAIRDAANGPEFVNEVKSRFGITVTVIDGEREAELIYLGTREAVALNEQISLIMDIGGGSTEFILARRSEMIWKMSFRVGAARLLEKFCPSDPVSGGEVAAIYNYLEEQLKPLFDIVKQHPPVELIGSSGAFDSIVEMIHGELGGEPLTDGKTEYEIDMDRYAHISDLVKRSTLEQRKQIKGLVPMRFDMIVISCLLVDFVLEQFELNRLRVSTYSLKEGALADFIGRNS